MKKLFTILIIAIASCNPSGKTTNDSTQKIISSNNVSDSNQLIVNANISAKGEAILKLIQQLPEFKKSDKYIDSLTNHKKGLDALIFKPAKGEKNYNVQVGYNGTERFETYYNFYVDSTSYAIKVSDVIEGDIVPLDEWRMREAKRK
jgi:hypothetical protein